jgi:3-oxoacyl-[acyl-carrier protein] reductase
MLCTRRLKICGIMYGGNSNMSLQGQTAIITGASKGIGKAIAMSFAREKMNVVLSARTRSDLEKTAGEVEKLGGTPLVVPADVSKGQAVDKLVALAIERFGKIDILINNAGIGVFAPVDELQTQDFDRMFAVNMRGVFLCSRAVLPYMKKQNSGVIINISSLAGKNFFKGGAGYAASKWALNGFTKCLMLEAREFNIRVSIVCPGSVITEFSTHDGRDPEKLLQPQDVADSVLGVLKLPPNALMSEIDLRPTNPK